VQNKFVRYPAYPIAPQTTSNVVLEVLKTLLNAIAVVAGKRMSVNKKSERIMKMLNSSWSLPILFLLHQMRKRYPFEMQPMNWKNTTSDTVSVSDSVKVSLLVGLNMFYI
jgi:hypothetical protein